jgi:hypothetical protein
LRNHCYSAEHGIVVADQVVIVGGHETTVELVIAPRSADSTEALARALVACETGHADEQRNAWIATVDPDWLHAFYVLRLGEAASLAETADASLAAFGPLFEALKERAEELMEAHADYLECDAYEALTAVINSQCGPADVTEVHLAAAYTAIGDVESLDFGA